MQAHKRKTDSSQAFKPVFKYKFAYQFSTTNWRYNKLSDTIKTTNINVPGWKKKPSNIEQKWNKRKTKKSIPITLLLQTSYRKRWLNQRLGKARMVLDWFSAHHIYIEPFAIASKISRVDEKSTSESTPSSSDPTSTHIVANQTDFTWHMTRKSN